MTEARPQKMMIPVEESFTAWRKDPNYVAAYDALEEEFARAAAPGSRLRISFGRASPRRGEGR
jgi:hypothetical protein